MEKTCCYYYYYLLIMFVEDKYSITKAEKKHRKFDFPYFAFSILL